MRFEDLEFVNYRNIIEAIARLDSPSRATVAKELSLSKTTISYVVGELIERGIVEETTTEDNGRRGRPGLGLRLKNDGWMAIGASFDSSHWRFVKTNLSGGIVLLHEGNDIKDLTPETLVEALIEGLEWMFAHSPERLLPGIGLGLPGIVDSVNSRILLANDLKWHDPINVGDIIRDKFGFNAYAVNRFTAAGLAEFRYANPEGEKNMIYIGLGHGIRSAIFIDGRLLRGATYSAGRIAHIVVDPNGPVCDCGKKGCLLTVANNDALVKRADELRKEKRYISSRLNSYIETLDVETICSLADEYDSCAMESIDALVAPLSKGLGEICDIINPKKIIIGGPIGYSSKYLV
ncbi:MAG: ROK family transcriptional regulator, partial [Candidatus Ornithospirochaeta sp.]